MEKVKARKKGMNVIHIFLETGVPVCGNYRRWS
jgi:hypothetical protein